MPSFIKSMQLWHSLLINLGMIFSLSFRVREERVAGLPIWFSVAGIAMSVYNAKGVVWSFVTPIVFSISNFRLQNISIHYQNKANVIPNVRVYFSAK